MLHMSLKPRKLQFAEYIPNRSRLSFSPEPYTKAYRYIILVKNPNHPAWTYFLLKIDDQGRLRGGGIGAESIPSRVNS